MTDYSDWTREDLIEELNKIRPAQAEQGEGPTREWIRCQAEDVADYIRDTTLKLSTAPAGNKVVSYPLCKTREEAIDKVIAFSRALLASRPQPEAKVVPMAMLREIMQGASDFGPSDESARVIVAKHMPGYKVVEK
jgi:hypothetical protein